MARSRYVSWTPRVTAARTSAASAGARSRSRSSVGRALPTSSHADGASAAATWAGDIGRNGSRRKRASTSAGSSVGQGGEPVRHHRAVGQVAGAARPQALDRRPAPQAPPRRGHRDGRRASWRMSACTGATSAHPARVGYVMQSSPPGTEGGVDRRPPAGVAGSRRPPWARPAPRSRRRAHPRGRAGSRGARAPAGCRGRPPRRGGGWPRGPRDAGPTPTPRCEGGSPPRRRRSRRRRTRGARSAGSP